MTGLNGASAYFRHVIPLSARQWRSLGLSASSSVIGERRLPPEDHSDTAVTHGRGDSIFAGFDYPAYERFSQDADWMSNVVLMSKMVYVWLDQLSRSHGYSITRLDQIPDSELDRLASWGFTGLWLIGLWERSQTAQRIKQICGNPDAIASVYSLFDYEIAEDLGGWDALANLRERAAKRGIRLASDMVPNHTGICSRWVINHPDRFVQTDYNSAFMNMPKREENHKYRTTIKNVLEFNPEVLKRFVNFMYNPDEKTAVEQFGTQGKYFGACVLLATMPGLPMFGHGQIEGFHEKYGVEYKRAYWDEQVDEGLVRGHEMWVFPLLRLRWLFSGSENFMLYDFHCCDYITENVFAYSNRAGDKRTLVMYNNSFSSVAGWIRESAGYAVKNGSGEPKIQSTTMGVALGLSNEEGVYCTFNDYATGLTYLRNSRELCEYGFYAELKEYQFHVFLDFREIRDDAEGNWERLCTTLLDGSGVESLEDELKQMRYGALNEAFKSVTELVYGELVCKGLLHSHRAEIVKHDQGAATAAARVFFVEMHRLVHDTTSPHWLHKQLEMAELRFNRLASLLKTKPVSQVAKIFRSRLIGILRQPDECWVLLAWGLLSGMKSDVLEQFGLDCTLRRMLSPDIAKQSLDLMSALLELPEKQEMAAYLFVTPACRNFLAVHESMGTEWFNKERFEELCEWLAIVGLLDAGELPEPPSDISIEMVKAERILEKQYEQAEIAGYRTVLYQRMPGGR